MVKTEILRPVAIIEETSLQRDAGELKGLFIGEIGGLLGNKRGGEVSPILAVVVSEDEGESEGDRLFKSGEEMLEGLLPDENVPSVSARSFSGDSFCASLEEELSNWWGIEKKPNERKEIAIKIF